LGARQVGGGFGGCVLFLLENTGLDAVLERITIAYQEETGILPTVIPVATGEGAGVV